MGGSVFAQSRNGEPALSTPRMPPELYYAEKAKYLALLAKFYNTVTSPAEAPEKPDHGDIDLLVETPRYEFTTETLAVALQAVRHVSNGVTTSFAVPYPGHRHHFIPLDVHTCMPDFTEWTSFMNSYGDLMQIVGVTLRSVGLTANDRGLHLRIAEIEAENKEASRIYLSHNPGEVMALLGLDAEAYDRGFATEEELFRWCAAGRFFHPDPFRAKCQTANDRQRLKKRPAFARFVREWLPAHPEYGHGSVPTRQEVLEEVLDTFHVREEYNSRMEKKVLDERQKALVSRTRFWHPASRREAEPRHAGNQALGVHPQRRTGVGL